MSIESTIRACWCGPGKLDGFSADYRVCRSCGTLVSRAPLRDNADDRQFYGQKYWHDRQTKHHGLPGIAERARLDLPERCTHWLRHLLARRLPPARVLEVGCGHGGYLALLGWAGFEAIGTEMDRWVVDFAKKSFSAKVFAGRVEDIGLPPKSFDVIVLNDVLEHLPCPQQTLGSCVELLTESGFIVIQTPEYKEHLTHADLVASNDLFLKHMDGNNEEHLFLFSRRSIQILFERLGLGRVEFANPVYTYDMFFTASRRPLSVSEDNSVAATLQRFPSGRLVLALLDKAYESNDRWWAIQRLEKQLGPGGA